MNSSITAAVKAVLLVVSALCVWHTLTPPHRSAPSERLPPLNRIGRWAVVLATCLKLLHVSSCAWGAMKVLVQIPKGLRTDETSISFTFVCGCALTIGGAILRFACFRALGQFFTFEMSIRKDHRLITSGPYAFVRHPAYTGLVMTMWGTVLVRLGSGIHEVNDGLLAKLYLLFIVVPVLLMTYNSTLRGMKEDHVLREQFGSEWDVWAKQTPYRMLPYFY